MSGEYEKLEICNSPSLVKQLNEKSIIFTSNMEYDLTPALEQLLHKHNILLQVKYLLTEGVNAKTYFYALCTKDLIKFPDKSSSYFYVWNPENALWEEEKRVYLKNLSLKYLIESIYITIYLIVNEIDDTSVAICKNKNSKLISTTNELKFCLLKMKDAAISIAKIREILHSYIEYVVDPEFSESINPKGYIAVSNRQVVNLKTGEVRERTKTDYFTQEIPVKYNPNSRSNLLDNTINQIMLYDKEKINFLQEILGYSITANCEEGKIFLFIGETRGGKSILMNLLESTLGVFSTFLGKSVLVNTTRTSDLPDPFIAELKNKRVGIINDMGQTDIIHTGKMKNLAENEKYPFRLLFSNKIEKTVSKHVLFITSNHKPIFPETDDSIWQRLVLVEFKAKFVENPEKKDEFKADRKLRSKLESPEEKEAFLKWMIDGAVRYYQTEKLNIPQSSLRILDEYKMFSQDENELYFQSRLRSTEDQSDRIQSAILYSDYKNWCRNNSVKKLSSIGFAELLSEKGVPKIKSNTYYYTNVKFKE